ncbi:AraC-like DNA-binding protein [Granulicella aggregans]|uniref:AraC-like DNA-binding protein n=1 Tax=Granulicella aggregans TaxID=474949 RepID=A0A7W8E7A1_9BACT|nr:hypothetical protein [Granulicella aggregans]MBB5060035.1 AraC-like DNA-binding protein [Granulicella aggregans]
MRTPIFATGELLYFAAALPAIDADVARVISLEAKATITYLCITIYGYGFGIFAMFYGIAAAVRGYLIWRSGYCRMRLAPLACLIEIAGESIASLGPVLGYQFESAFKAAFKWQRGSSPRDYVRARRLESQARPVY